MTKTKSDKKRKRTQPNAYTRRSAAKTIVQILGDEFSVVATPLSHVDVKNIPNTAEPAVRRWIKQHARHEVYGSAAMATHQIHARQPQDLDLVIDDPRRAANALAGVMRAKGVKCRVVPSKSVGSFIVQTQNKGRWVDALDIHPLKGHTGTYDFYGQSQSPLTQNGINIQRAADQLLRKANSLMQKGGPAAHRELKDTMDFVTTAKMLLASMETRTAAQQARTKKVKEAIKVWEAYLKTIKGAPKSMKRKQISKTKKKQFVDKAVAIPDVDVDALVFVSEKRVTARKHPEQKKTILEIMNDNTSTPYPRGRNPYKQPQNRRKKRKKGDLQCDYLTLR